MTGSEYGQQKWAAMWNQRYNQPDFVFGEEPNEFLRANIDQIPAGKVLCAGDGEGRNGVWLARHGYSVTAVDYSQVGLEKARWYAEQSAVEIEFICADLVTMNYKPETYAAVVHIFVHMDEKLLPRLHENYRQTLKPGGIFMAEVYSKRQLNYSSGGPQVAEALYECDYYHRDFNHWEILYLNEEIVTLEEGASHQGPASVIRVIARKPQN